MRLVKLDIDVLKVRSDRVQLAMSLTKLFMAFFVAFFVKHEDFPLSLLPSDLEGS